MPIDVIVVFPVNRKIDAPSPFIAFSHYTEISDLQSGQKSTISFMSVSG